MNFLQLSVVAALMTASSAANAPVDLRGACQWCYGLAHTVTENDRHSDVHQHTSTLEAFCHTEHGEQLDWGECMERALPLSAKLTELLASGHDKMSACVAMSICERETGSHSVRNKQPQSNTTCALCEFVISVLQELLSENATEHEVIKALEAVCGKMPVTIRQECTSFVEKWGPPIVQLIMEKLDPQLVCREINVCPHDLQLEDSNQAGDYRSHETSNPDQAPVATP